MNKGSFCLSSLCLSSALFFSISGQEDRDVSLEYTPEYCMELEAAYGDGMMSEGGSEGIDMMFEGVELSGKKAVDIGSGLGGVPFYLAEKWNMNIVGVEVNSWMVDESKKRTPKHLREQVDFILTTGNSNWPLNSESFDLVYSKGVLTHLETKDEIFTECRRLLKQDGLLIITDWLSADDKKWGQNIAKLVELENLILFPETEKGYIQTLEQNGFTVLSVRDESVAYRKYNLSIVEKLTAMLPHSKNKQVIEDSITGYRSIAHAMETGELRVLRFIAKKTLSLP